MCLLPSFQHLSIDIMPPAHRQGAVNDAAVSLSVHTASWKEVCLGIWGPIYKISYDLS